MAKAPSVPLDRLPGLLSRLREQNPDDEYLLVFASTKDSDGNPDWQTEGVEDALHRREPGTYAIVDAKSWEPLARSSVARTESKKPTAAEAAAVQVSEAWAMANADLKETIRELRGELKELRAERDNLKEQLALKVAGEGDEFPGELIALAREAMHMFGGKASKREIMLRFNRLSPKLREIIGDENLIAVAHLLRSELELPPPEDAKQLEE